MTERGAPAIAAFAAFVSFATTLVVFLAGVDGGGTTFWVLLLALIVLTVVLALTAFVLLVTGKERTASEVARWVSFLVVALVIAPAAGLYVSAWLVGWTGTGGSDSGAWIALLGTPAALTVAAGLLTRRSGWTSVMVASLSAGLSFLALVALIFYAASQGAFD